MDSLKLCHALLVGPNVGIGVVPADWSLLVRSCIFAKVLVELLLRLQKRRIVVLLSTYSWLDIYYFPLLLTKFGLGLGLGFGFGLGLGV